MAAIKGTDVSALETVQQSDINATADADNTVVAAPAAGLKIKILELALTASAAGIVQLKSGAGTVRARFTFPVNGGIVLPMVALDNGLVVPHLELAAAQAFVINNAAGVDSLGHVVYVVEA